MERHVTARAPGSTWSGRVLCDALCRRPDALCRNRRRLAQGFVAAVFLESQMLQKATRDMTKVTCENSQ